MTDLQTLNTLILTPNSMFECTKVLLLAGNKTEYVIKKFVKGKKELLFVGTSHTKDPSNPIFNELNNQMKLFRPQMSLVEGHRNLKLYKEKLIHNQKKLGQEGREDPVKIRANIRRNGETGHFVFLLANSNYDFDTAEPTKDMQVELVNLGFTHEEIFVLMVLRTLLNFYRSPYPDYKEEVFRDKMTEPLDIMKQTYNWGGFDFSFDNFKKQFQIITGQEFIITNKQFNSRAMNYFRSVEFDQPPTRLQLIDYHTIRLRDISVLSQIHRYIQEYDKVMINMGQAHLHTLTPALEKLFKSIE